MCPSWRPSCAAVSLWVAVDPSAHRGRLCPVPAATARAIAHARMACGAMSAIVPAGTETGMETRTGTETGMGMEMETETGMETGMGTGIASAATVTTPAWGQRRCGDATMVVTGRATTARTSVRMVDGTTPLIADIRRREVTMSASVTITHRGEGSVMPATMHPIVPMLTIARTAAGVGGNARTARTARAPGLMALTTRTGAATGASMVTMGIPTAFQHAIQNRTAPPIPGPRAIP